MMAAKLSSKSDNEVHVTYEDQQKINLFARTNARLQDLREELETKKKGVQNLEDCETDIMMMDEEDHFPNQIGEVFVHLSHAETLERLASMKAAVQDEMKELERRCGDHRQTLSDLKVQLYSKFGNNINLEADED
jgi:prefoldin subunit 4